jgi:hypothetical protein
MAAQGLEVERDAPAEQPDEGWAGSPASAEETDRAIARLRRTSQSLRALEPPRLASKGSAPYATPGDLGAADAARKAAVVDRLAGLSSAQAKAQAGSGPCSVSRPLRSLGRGQVEAAVPLASQYLDGAEQLVSRLAQDPRLGRLVRSLQVTGRASYALGAEVAGPELVVGGGLVRSTELVVSVLGQETELDALGRLVIQAEGGHGAPIRRAAAVSGLVLRGTGSDVEGYRAAWLCWAPGQGGRVVLRLAAKPIAGTRAERVLVTEAKFKELTK